MSLRSKIHGNINNAILELRSLVIGAYEWKNETLPADLVKHGAENAERYLEEAKKDLTALSVLHEKLRAIADLCNETLNDYDDDYSFLTAPLEQIQPQGRYEESLENTLMQIKDMTYRALSELRDDLSPAPTTEEVAE